MSKIRLSGGRGICSIGAGGQKQKAMGWGHPKNFLGGKTYVMNRALHHFTTFFFFLHSGIPFRLQKEGSLAARWWDRRSFTNSGQARKNRASNDIRRDLSPSTANCSRSILLVSIAPKMGDTTLFRGYHIERNMEQPEKKYDISHTQFPKSDLLAYKSA